jgi:hypothetical protein
VIPVTATLTATAGAYGTTAGALLDEDEQEALL